MSNTYAFQRPVVVTDIVPKKVRRNKGVPAEREQYSSTFKYSCYKCGQVVAITTHDDVEIECANCGSRVVRKQHTLKQRVVQAV